MGTIIVGIIVFAIIGLALYFSLRKPKGGGCHGCSGCSTAKDQSKEEHCCSGHTPDQSV